VLFYLVCHLCELHLEALLYLLQPLDLVVQLLAVLEQLYLLLFQNVQLALIILQRVLLLLEILKLQHFISLLLLEFLQRTLLILIALSQLRDQALGVNRLLVELLDLGAMLLDEPQVVGGGLVVVGFEVGEGLFEVLY
jgi:hypothetical protein